MPSFASRIVNRQTGFLLPVRRVSQNEVIGDCVPRQPPNALPAAHVILGAPCVGVQVKSNGTPVCPDHCRSVEYPVDNFGIAEHQRTPRADELRSSFHQSVVEIEGGDISWGYRYGRQRGLRAVRRAQRRRHGQWTRFGIIAEQQFGAPARLGCPIDEELLLRGRGRRRNDVLARVAPSGRGC